VLSFNHLGAPVPHEDLNELSALIGAFFATVLPALTIEPDGIVRTINETISFEGRLTLRFE
jgi:hypothetical protein